MSELHKNKHILLFDGVCNLCIGSVQFIIRHDPLGNIKFTSLQSEKGKILLKTFNLAENELKSMVFIENGMAFTRSTGALKVTRYLAAPWPILYALIIVPRFIRDAVYEMIGKNRYRWFGQKSACWLPTPELQSRFLEP